LNRAECKAACQLHLTNLNLRNIGINYQVKKVGIVPAHSIKSCIRQVVRQVVFTDVLIVGRLDVDGKSFAPFGLHKIDAASDWLLIKSHCIRKACRESSTKLIGLHTVSYRCDFSIYQKEDVLFHLKIRCASKNSKTSRGPY
jgi:hypothetical protein